MSTSIKSAFEVGIVKEMLPMADGIDVAVWRKPAAASAVASVLLLHGVTFSSLTAWDLDVPGYKRSEFSTFLRFAEAGCNVYAMDQAGYGASGAHPSLEPFSTFVDETARVASWIKTRSPQTPLYVLGWSWGAHLAGSLSCTKPHLVDGLVFYGSFWGGGSRYLPDAIANSEPPPQGIRRTNNSLYMRKNFITEAYFDPIVRDRYIEKGLEIDPTSPNAGLHHVLYEYPMTDPSLLQCSVLLIHGDCDRVVSLPDMQEMFEAVPHIRKRHTIVPGGDHPLHLNVGRDGFYNETIRFIRHNVSAS